MKLVKFLMIAAFVLIIGGFGYIATTDVKIEQETVVKTIPNDRFLKNE